MKMFYRYRSKYYFIIISAAIFLGACKKYDLSSIQLDYTSIKVYDDTLASAENVNVHVSAGRERMYMVYGRGSTVLSIWNYMYFQTQEEISSVLMAADMQGNMIWRCKLPGGLAISSAAELADGSCIVAGADVYDYNVFLPNDIMYLFHFDRSGNPLKTDSIVLPQPDFYPGGAFMHLDLLHLSGNDILVYGTASSSDWLKWRSFSIRYNPGTGMQWAKPIDFLPPSDTTNNTAIYNCTKTRDGGLIFIGSFDGPDEPGDSLMVKNVVIKTTTNCDILWKKWYDFMLQNAAWNQVSPTNIIQRTDGSYLFCTNDVPGLSPAGNVWNPLIFKSYIYHLNQEGDSIGGTTISNEINSYCSGILEDGSSNIVGLFNKYPDYVYINFESYYKPFNTELRTFDPELNLLSETDLQTQRTDFMHAVCKLPNGDVAFFGITSSYNHQFYQPALIIKR